MSLICPSPECQQEVATRDGVHYGTHFQNIMASKPCPMSGKQIVIKERATREMEPAAALIDQMKFEGAANGSVDLKCAISIAGSSHEAILKIDDPERFLEDLKRAFAESKLEKFSR